MISHFWGNEYLELVSMTLKVPDSSAVPSTPGLVHLCLEVLHTEFSQRLQLQLHRQVLQKGGGRVSLHGNQEYRCWHRVAVIDVLSAFVPMLVILPPVYSTVTAIFCSLY